MIWSHLLAFVLLSAATSIGAAQQKDARLYTNETFGWSVSHPASWEVNDKDPSYVTILLPSGEARCGFFTRAVPFETVDELTDTLMEKTARALRESKGLLSLVESRHPIQLLGGIPAREVIVNIVPGGKTRRVFALVDGHAYVIDCETYVQTWSVVEPDFDVMIRSFAVDGR